MKYVARTFQKAGKWVERPTHSMILTCPTCGSKYIKTRDDQKVCVKCMYGHTQASRQ